MPERPDRWKIVSSRELADCRVFKVREDLSERDSDAMRAPFYVVESPDWVNIAAVTTTREMILIEQFRHGAGSVILEVPGGMVDTGEDHREAAMRELREETGFTAGRMIAIGSSHPNPAIQNNSIHHFLALECERTEAVAFDEHESIRTRLVPLHEVEDLVHNGELTHSLAITALYYANRFLQDENIIA